jgi:dihydrodipicolinate synthase/N-acetylneuraminate lyase
MSFQRQHPGLQAALASPIPSLRTPFLPDGEIDYDGLRCYVERCLANGAKALMLTFGDSLYSVLTDAEVGQVTQAVVEQTRQRAVVIATVIAGGTKQLHAYLAPYGCRGHLSTLLVYRPEIAHAYWRAFQEGDFAEMAKIVREIDIPMFDALSRCPGGFDAGLHAWCELIGLCGRWRRSPYRSLTDAEMEPFAESLRQLGLPG